jgi:uncharacterized protein
VILVDANILIYASNEAARQHVQARDWLNDRLTGAARVGLPWPALLAFLRITTDARILPRPLTMPAAWRQVSEWLACEAAWIPQPTERHAILFGELLALPAVHGNLVTDAHLAALAIEHGLILCSVDGDFARFAKLRWQNPLAA